MFLCFFPPLIDSKSIECPIDVNIIYFAIYLLFSCACVGGASVLAIPSCPTMRISYLQLCQAALELENAKRSALPNTENLEVEVEREERDKERKRVFFYTIIVHVYTEYTLEVQI